MKYILNQSIAKFGDEWFRFDQTGKSVAEASDHWCNFCVGAFVGSLIDWRAGNSRLYLAQDISFFSGNSLSTPCFQTRLKCL